MDNTMPILLVPGLVSSPRIYAPVIPALWRYGPVTVANHVRDDNMALIARRILAEAPPRFALAGHSMGGYIAFEILRQAPERVAKLALMNTQARPDTPEATTRRRGLVARAQPLVEVARRAVVRRVGDGGPQDDAARARRRRHVHGLDVFVVGADIADMRKGEGDELPGIGGIGENLLITGHRGVEADFADRLAFRAEAEAFQHGAIGKHEERGRFVVRPG